VFQRFFSLAAAQLESSCIPHYPPYERGRTSGTQGNKGLKDLKYNLKNDPPEICCIYFSMKGFVLSANNAERWSLPASPVYKLSSWRTYIWHIFVYKDKVLNINTTGLSKGAF
jgi:hypothetical protein